MPHAMALCAYYSLATCGECYPPVPTTHLPPAVPQVVREMVAQHKASVAAGRGACLLAVYRGALSEVR